MFVIEQSFRRKSLKLTSKELCFVI
uniref:Uncharacterized protein n=1 Tax=Anguilla anguilla TaxID=7936 RepID=A0A0E9SFR8_ANGAN